MRSKQIEFKAPVLEEIWVPDVYYVNQIALFGTQERKVMLYPSGKVKYRVRTGRRINCEMDFKHMPFDTQACAIQVSTLVGSRDDTDLQVHHV